MKVSALSSEQIAQAQRTRLKVQTVLDQVKALDNQPGDLSPKVGEVVLDAGSKVSLPPEDRYQREVQTANLGFEPSNGQVLGGEVEVKSYYNTSYGPSAPSFARYSKETRVEKDGFLGLFGTPRKLDVYRIQSSDILSNRTEVAKFDPSGNVCGSSSEKYTVTFGQCLKDVVTTPAGLALIGVSGALCGLPGTLGYALAGPVVGGLTGAGLATVGLAYAKYRTWND